MNVIRFNWRLIRRILAVLFFLFVFVRIIEFVTDFDESILKYNPKTRELFIRKDLLNEKQLLNARYSQTSSGYVEFQIRSILIRYTLVPVQYWTSLIENAIDLGMNTIEIEVIWNSHEPMYKKYDFKMNSNDLNLFIGKFSLNLTI